jgi:hypothetical protein
VDITASLKNVIQKRSEVNFEHGYYFICDSSADKATKFKQAKDYFRSDLTTASSKKANPAEPKLFRIKIFANLKWM